MSLPFTFHEAWGNLDEADAGNIVDFWLREKALPNEEMARERLDQIVYFARARDSGEIAGVCSAMPQTPPQLGLPVYYYRTFIGNDWRHTRLVFYLLARATAFLEAYARERDFPCVGVLLELENTRFRDTARRRVVWRRPPYVYIGKSPRGLEVRIHYFEGAPMKRFEPGPNV